MGIGKGKAKTGEMGKWGNGKWETDRENALTPHPLQVGTSEKEK